MAVAIEYVGGQVHGAKILGGSRDMDDCLKAGAALAQKFLADPATPNGVALNVACVPIPPAPPAKGDLKL